jgi:hypothetical protein
MQRRDFLTSIPAAALVGAVPVAAVAEPSLVDSVQYHAQRLCELIQQKVLGASSISVQISHNIAKGEPVDIYALAHRLEWREVSDLPQGGLLIESYIGSWEPVHGLRFAHDE